jgi:ribonucleoside-triphosphate reductase
MFCKLNKKQIKQKIEFIEKYSDKSNNAATSSFLDPNANIENKNIATMMSEIHKDVNIQVNRDIIGGILLEKYGKSVKDKYFKDIKDHNIYINDETSLFPYCCSVSLYPFLLNGTLGIDGVSKAPKHLNSFCGSYINLIFQLAAQFAGAIATPEVLMIFDYYARKDFGDNYLETHKKEINAHLQQVVYSINQPAASRNYQSAFTNWAIFDKYYFEGLLGDFYFPCGEKASWDNVDKIQRYFMEWFNKEREVAILTFPVVTASILSENNDIKDTETVDFLCDQLSKGNSFFIYQSDQVDTLSSCCRLRNQIEKKEFSFTLGAGGIKTGSKKVITINANRLVQTNKNWALALKKLIKRVHMYLLAHEVFFQKMYDNGMLPVYSANYITLKDQFLTIGVNGIVEAAEFLGINPDPNEGYFNFLQKFLKIIFDENKETGSKNGVKFNTEFVPAESLGVKNASWDKRDGLITKRDCYNSYFYPSEDESLSIIDKFNLHGDRVLKYLDGGSALHLNLENYPTKDGYKNIIKLAISTGCNYFTTNVLVTLCKKCGHIDKITTDKCRKCESSDVSHATRIIGYLKEIKKFSQDRQKEASKRFYQK